MQDEDQTFTRMGNREINQQNLNRFEERTAIITGSTRGIGEGIARRLASEGAQVVISGRSEEDGRAISDELSSAGNDAVFIQADMGNDNDIQNLVTATVEEFGGIDILINNAAAWQHGGFQTRTTEDWDTVMDVSLKGPWLASKYATEYMSENGRVINISSIHGDLTDPGRFPYNTAKAGLNGLTRAMALDLKGRDITVNGISPGRIVVDESKDPIEAGHDRYANIVPVDRCGNPQDIAAAVAFLASEESGFINAATITVDGGWTSCLFDDMSGY
jgi:NAD(P)-dependent dehydrogenase (short-subunit alcohol dehydrogenase family)